MVNTEHRRGIYFMMFLMVWFVGTVVAVGVGIDVLYALGIDIDPMENMPYIIIIQQVVGLLVPLGVWLAITREKLSVYLPRYKLGALNILYIILLTFLLQPLMMVVSGLTSLFFPNEVGELMQGGLATHSYFMMIVAIAVTPAICEEVAFRGYIQGRYKHKPFWTMAVMNGLLFGIMHFNPQQFFYAFGMGIIFAYIVHATRNIKAGIISHFFVNASSVTIMWGALWLLDFMEERGWGGEALETAAEPTTREVLQSMGLLGVVAIFTTTGAYFLGREFHKYNKKRFATIDAKAVKVSLEKPADIPAAPPSPAPDEIRKNRIIDAALIAVVVALYVLVTFVLFG